MHDPLSGEKPAIRGTRNRWVDVNFRFARSFYLSEINRSWEGPVWLAVYAENKDLWGLTVRAGINNLLNARHRFERTAYDGRRLREPVPYAQSNDELIGRIFHFLVKGTF